MIESIFIKNVATYNSSGIYINGLKKINFIYGARVCSQLLVITLNKKESRCKKGALTQP